MMSMSTFISTNTHQLPTETWTEIASYLPHAYQLPLLWVSRKFHDIALRFLFSAVKVYFVGEQFTTMFDIESEEERDETISGLMTKSWEILHCIMHNPEFAGIVKSISVFAFADSLSVFEKMSLGQALLCLSDLRTFNWFGLEPAFSSSLFQCLPRSLQVLNVQSLPFRQEASHLDSLHRLQVENLLYYRPWTQADQSSHAYFDNLLLLPSNTIPLVMEVSTTLRQLCILSYHLEEIPIHIYSSLTELEICVPEDSNLIGMDLIFRHIPLLESLSLVGCITSDIFTILPQDPVSMQNLRSFRLSIDAVVLPVVSEEHVYVLSRFLGNQKKMRRLAIRLAGAYWGILCALLPTINSFEFLEVLGFHTGCENLSVEVATSLASILSPRLTSVYLAATWNNPDYAQTEITCLSPLLDKLKTLQRLTFFHLYGGYSGFPVVAEDLVAELEKLEVIGINRRMWDIMRKDSQSYELVEWKMWRSQFFIQEDFRYQDDAWLFKYH
ncbi:hypothetical protein Hypma_007622 [Hypsizygus marmoreus]|uniref:F-box domain-containing protein n=1 Tax=Hypsizygus marmoreus TaxID=39966 RepID=A0A369JX52_HYPMA|nr:hypothetical protein Hypma_007622 [Hypsizygus marmoreus]